MNSLVFVLRVALASALFAADVVARPAAFLPDGDGWHAWDVPAGAQGSRACCYNLRNGMTAGAGCRLGRGEGGVTIDGDCDPQSDSVRIYVFREDGQVREIRALSAACPVQSSTPVRELGAVDADASIAWLVQQAVSGTETAEDALVAIAMHADTLALPALQSLIEDRKQDRDLREQALFWLAQSDSDEAYRYIDELLSRR